MEITEIIFQIVLHTPWWVYLILMYLLIIGLQASKERVVSIQKLFILPIVFTVLSLSSWNTSLGISNFSVGTWIITALIGLIVGWISVKGLNVRVDKKNWLIEMPGTWSTLLIVLIIFSIKYYFEYQLASNPFLSGDIVFQSWRSGVAGLGVGLLLGRLSFYLHRLWIGEHANLKES